MMRRLFLATSLALAIAVGGCGSTGSLPNPFEVVAQITAPRPNPVTPKMLNDTQKALTAAVQALNIYGRLCVRKVIADNCWTVIERIQPYTRQARALLPEIRRFVRQNDQVNAIQAYNTLKGLIETIKQESIAQGVT